MKNDSPASDAPLRPITFIRARTFKKALKALGKYPSIIEDLNELLAVLESNPQHGSPLGKNCFKVRMAIASKQAGKSGGARVITYVRLTASEIILLDVYDKSEKDSIDDKFLDALIKAYLTE